LKRFRQLLWNFGREIGELVNELEVRRSKKENEDDVDEQKEEVPVSESAED
jgi:hypothetical protein